MAEITSAQLNDLERRAQEVLKREPRDPSAVENYLALIVLARRGLESKSQEWSGEHYYERAYAAEAQAQRYREMILLGITWQYVASNGWWRCYLGSGRDIYGTPETESGDTFMGGGPTKEAALEALLNQHSRAALEES